MRPILLDASAIVAYLDRNERLHDVCADAMDATQSPLITCEPVIAESCYLLRRHFGGANAVLENVSRGWFQIPWQLSQDAPAIQRILHRYRDREIDLADACLIHLATEFRTGEILTLDSDFEIYRWGGNNRFRLLVSRD